MISRRNFVMLTAIMLVVLFMFQAAGVAKHQLNDAQTNTYASENKTELSEQGVFSSEKQTPQEPLWTGDTLHKRLILFVGDAKESAVLPTVRQWCDYSKRALQIYEKPEECEAHLQQAEMILIDTHTTDIRQEVARLQEYVDAGANLLFCNLPDAETIGANVPLESLLGIMTVYHPQVQLAGVQLFDGFLLGGEQIYYSKEAEEQDLQDMELTVPWYLTLNANKSYMIGLLEDLKLLDGEVDNEYAPSLIWRNSAGNGAVFVVNGAFLEDVTGVGILSALAADLHDYEIYPIVNAQNFSVVNYPSFAEENSKEMEKRYSRELPSLYRDVIWQSISSVTERKRSKTTALLSPQYDYTDANEPMADHFTYYAHLFREKQMEIGLSLEQVLPETQISLEEKVARDLSFLQQYLGGYEYRGVYLPNAKQEELQLVKKQSGLDTVTTVLTDYEESEPLFSFTDGLCIQRATNDAFSHTYTENLRMRALESALGYTSVLLNMKHVAYPQSNQDSWEKLYEEFSSNLMTYWDNYAVFDETTLSESDVRIRRFLNMNYRAEKKAEQIFVKTEQFGEEAFYIFRMHGEAIKEVSGGTFVQIEPNAYLLHAAQAELVITLEEKQEPMFY